MAVINASLDAHEQLEKIVVIADSWTVENGMLTPTFKLIRNKIEKNYQDQFEAWYADDQAIVFSKS
jgi:long-chain acyl-CoA synthetase